MTDTVLQAATDAPAPAGLLCLRCGRVFLVDESSAGNQFMAWICWHCGLGDQLRAHALGMQWD